jgi:hypothetical protein
MATWVAHFRIAQALLEQGYNFHRQMFLVGNIAPDSGVLSEDRLAYIPDKTVSHWKNADQNIEPERFYQTYLDQRPDDDKEYAFLMGYYCHLIADKVWVERIWRPKRVTPLYAKGLEKDKQFVWEIKKDWYGLDFLYLQEHPTSIFYTDFVQVETVPDYLPSFPDGAFTCRIRDTKEFYLGDPDWDLERPYIYLNRAEWDDYVNHALTMLQEALHNKL